MAVRDFCVTLLCINGRCSKLDGAISRKSLISTTRYCLQKDKGYEPKVKC